MEAPANASFPVADGAQSYAQEATEDHASSVTADPFASADGGAVMKQDKMDDAEDSAGYAERERDIAGPPESAAVVEPAELPPMASSQDASQAALASDDCPVVDREGTAEVPLSAAGAHGDGDGDAHAQEGAKSQMQAAAPDASVENSGVFTAENPAAGVAAADEESSINNEVSTHIDSASGDAPRPPTSVLDDEDACRDGAGGAAGNSQHEVSSVVDQEVSQAEQSLIEQHSTDIDVTAEQTPELAVQDAEPAEFNADLGGDAAAAPAAIPLIVVDIVDSADGDGERESAGYAEDPAKTPQVQESSPLDPLDPWSSAHLSQQTLSESSDSKAMPWITTDRPSPSAQSPQSHRVPIPADSSGEVLGDTPAYLHLSSMYTESDSSPFEEFSPPNKGLSESQQVLSKEPSTDGQPFGFSRQSQNINLDYDQASVMSHQQDLVYSDRMAIVQSSASFVAPPPLSVSASPKVPSQPAEPFSTTARSSARMPAPPPASLSSARSPRVSPPDSSRSTKSETAPDSTREPLIGRREESLSSMHLSDFARIGDDREEDTSIFSGMACETVLRRRCLFLDPFQPGRPLTVIEDFLRKHVLPLFGSSKLSPATEKQLDSFRKDAKQLVRDTFGAKSASDSVFFVGENSMDALSRWIDMLHLRQVRLGSSSSTSSSSALGMREGNAFTGRQLPPLRLPDRFDVHENMNAADGGNRTSSAESLVPVVFLVKSGSSESDSQDPLYALWKETVVEIIPVSYSPHILHRSSDDIIKSSFQNANPRGAHRSQDDHSNQGYDSSYIDELHLERLLQSTQDRPLRIGCFRAVDPLSGRGAHVDRITALLHQYSALSIWDATHAMPYSSFTQTTSWMNSSIPAGNCDAIVGDLSFCPGGQSTSGMLVVSHRLLRNPDSPAGVGSPEKKRSNPTTYKGVLHQKVKRRQEMSRPNGFEGEERDLDYQNVPSLSQLVDAIVYLQHIQMMEAAEMSNPAQWIGIIRTGLVMQWRQSLSFHFLCLRPYVNTMRILETLFERDASFLLIDAPGADQPAVRRIASYYDPRSVRIQDFGHEATAAQVCLTNVPSISFLMVHEPSKRLLHPQFVSALVRDLFGIRIAVVRSCSSRTLSSSLLRSAFEVYGSLRSFTLHRRSDAASMNARPSDSFLTHVDDVDLSFSACWLSLSVGDPAMTDRVVSRLVKVLQFISQNALQFLPLYVQDAVTGDFRLNHLSVDELTNPQLSHRSSTAGDLTEREGALARRRFDQKGAVRLSMLFGKSLSPREMYSSRQSAADPAENLEAYLADAQDLANVCATSADILNAQYISFVNRWCQQAYGPGITECAIQGPVPSVSPVRRPQMTSFRVPWFLTAVEALEIMSSGCLARFAERPPSNRLASKHSKAGIPKNLKPLPPPQKPAAQGSPEHPVPSSRPPPKALRKKWEAQAPPPADKEQPDGSPEPLRYAQPPKPDVAPLQPKKQLGGYSKMFVEKRR
eukprot:ANDGO_04412.mRNA.1 hypothetical protein PHYSODRAFT_557789